MSASHSSSSHLKVTQLKSGIGRPYKQKRILKGLGLRGINKSVVVANTPDFRGAIKKVLHLVHVEETNG
ncbi:MAG: 50S ribosomal protein L30 [Myxococcota bacterium]